jgi:putative hemolysin
VVTTALELVAVALVVAANAFFVAAEYALVTVRRTRLQELEAQGSRAATRVLRLVDNPPRFISAIQLGVTLSSLALGAIGEPVVSEILGSALDLLPQSLHTSVATTISVIAAFVVLSFFHVVMGEIVPKSFTLQHAERVSLIVAGPINSFYALFRPFIWALVNASGAVLRWVGVTAPTGLSLVHSEEELKMLVTASQEAGVLEEEEEQMLHRVFGFADLTAGQVMVPRTEVVAVAADTPREVLIERLARGGHARIPVYRGDLDDVVGILHATDLLKAIAATSGPISPAALAREALAVPETLPADDVLAEMRRRGVREALVIDEYGGTAGLVTFESLMERIVGDIGGGFGGRPPRVAVLEDGSAEIDGLALVADINEQFGLHIDEETYNTVGGYVLGRLGRRPKVGDTVDVEGRQMRVDALDGLRVERVWLSVAAPEPPADSDRT